MPNDSLSRAHRLWAVALALCIAPGAAGAQGGFPSPRGAEVVTIFPDSLPDVARTLSELLSMRVPGLLVQRASGASGAGSWLSFRDAVAVRGGEPLIVVDGVALARPAAAFRATYENREPSPIDEIPVEEVERIDVFRGPAAAARYGREARRGVIAIATRRAGEGRASFRASAAGGMSTPRNRFPRNDVAVSANGMPCSYVSARLGYCTPVGRSSYTPLLAVDPFGGGDMYDAHLSASSGIRSLGFAAAATHGRTNGVFPADGEDHTVASAKVRIPYGRIGQLHLSTRATLRGVTLPMEGTGSFVRAGIFGFPIDCSPSTPCGPDTVSRGFRTFSPPNELANLGSHHRRQRFSSGAQLELTPLPGLSLRSLATHDNAGGRSRRNDRQEPRWGVRSNERAHRTTRTMLGQDVALAFERFGVDAATTLAVRSHHERSTSTFHELTVSDLGRSGQWGGGRAAERRLVATLAQRLSQGERLSGGFTVNRTQTRYLFGNPTPAVIDGGADLSLRLLGTSAGRLRRLSMRAAFGVVAGFESNDDRGIPFGPPEMVFVASGALGSPLKPDRTSEWEAGLDADLGERAEFGVTTFGRRETHRTLFHPITPDYYLAGPLRRRVSGTELSADLVPIDWPALRVRTRASYAVVLDHVSEYPNGDYPGLGAFFGSAFLSIGRGTSYGGWASSGYVYQDADGDGVLEDASEFQSTPIVPIGRSRPSRSALLATDVTVARWWTLAAQLDYRGGHKVLDRNEVARCTVSLCAAAYDSALAAQAYVARPGSAGYFVAGDAVRLRELSLSVAAPVLARIGGARGSTLTVAARNVAVWAKAEHIDPDAALPLPGTRADAFAPIDFPAPRTLTARVSVRF